MKKQILRISTAGSVDDGKSTLLGRLLFDTKNLKKDDIEKIKKKSNLKGEIDFSLFTDGLKDEVEQGITIDVAYRYFSTRKRKFIIADTPGHFQYTRNMITGGSLSNIMMILIDVKKGVTDQTKRHLFISSILRIDHLLICFNKMDLVGYEPKIFENLKEQIESFASKLTIKDINYIPISALKGDNILNNSREMSWYNGPTLLHYLENLHISSDNNKIKTRFFVQNVLRTKNNERRFIQGRIQSGIFKKGDDVIFYPSKIDTKIKNIIKGLKETDIAFSPMSISLEIEDEIDISRGDLMTLKNSNPLHNNSINVIVCWLANQSLIKNTQYKGIRISENFSIKFSNIFYKYNFNNLSREINPNEIKKNDIFKAELKISKPFYYDMYSETKDSGSFICIDQNNNTVACCIIVS